MKDYTKAVVILGSGLSGLMTAFELAQAGIKSVVLSKGGLIQTNTWKAQGGVAAAVSREDSIENHLKDTLQAGDGLCKPKNVEKILELGPQLIASLIQHGMNFDHNGKKISLGQEGGHHQRRVLHVDDKTGQALHEFLVFKLQSPEWAKFCKLIPHSMVQKVERSKNHNFQIEGVQTESLQRFKIVTHQLVLATGGAGKAFLYTSNWEGATGDGLKIAYDLGVPLVNLEMIQFHPTCLFHSQSKNFLISEALRGEGAKLLNHQGQRFVHQFHPDAELAPRDVVSRAIEHEIKRSGKDCVYLDITHKSPEYLKSRFPTIYQRCYDLGIDISTQQIPVVPAAHYTCGGIKTLEDLVSTCVPGLYAVGECGYTGLHGANRLASNSLLECLATAHLCAQSIKSESSGFMFKMETLDSLRPLHTSEAFLINALWEESRHLMWNYVGIQRSVDMLKDALNKILDIEEKAARIPYEAAEKDATELKNIIFFSKNCILSALERSESRGCHFLKDHPDKDSKLYNTEVWDNLVKKKFIQQGSPA